MKYVKKLLEKLKHNFFLKLLSLFVAFLMWMAVINSEDPVQVVTIRDVPVTIMNEQVIQESGKIPEVLSGETITVSVQARKSICDKLTKDDIIAIADYEKLSITNTVPIEVSVKNYSDSDAEIIRGQNQFVKLSLDDLETKEFKVKVVAMGDPRSGYVVASNIASPNVVTVSGSKTQLSKISDVIVTINVGERYNEFSSIVKPVALDGNGDIVSNDKITFSTDAITVSTIIYATKEISVEVNLVGEPNEDYEVTGISIQPAKVTVAGLRDDLKNLPVVLTTNIDVEGATSSVEANLNILDLIDKELTSIIAVDDSTIAVKVDIEKQQVEQRVLLPTEILLKGLKEELTAQLIGVDQRLISVQAKKEVLSNLTAEDLGAYIDLSGIKEPGDYDKIPVLFDTVDGVKVYTEVTATIKVSGITPQNLSDEEDKSKEKSGKK